MNPGVADQRVCHMRSGYAVTVLALVAGALVDGCTPAATASPVARPSSIPASSAPASSIPASSIPASSAPPVATPAPRQLPSFEVPPPAPVLPDVTSVDGVLDLPAQDIQVLGSFDGIVWLVVQKCVYVDHCADAVVLALHGDKGTPERLQHPPPALRHQVTQLLMPDLTAAILVDWGGGVTVTTDGRTWRQSQLPFTVGPDGRGGGVTLAVDSVRSWWLSYQPLCTAACGARWGVLYRSNDAGRSWKRVAPMPGVVPDTFIAIDAQHASVLSRGGAHMTTADGGRTWHTAR